MAITEGSLRVGNTEDKLDTTVVTQSDSTLAHREIVVLADPENFLAHANVARTGSVNALFVTTAPPVEDAVTGFGEQNISGTVNNVDIWGGPTIHQPEPDLGGYTLYVVSSNGADTLAGTGAQRVEVHYLDTAGVEKFVDVEMAGVAVVNTGVTDCMFVQNHHAYQVGTNLVSVGNIDCLNGPTGAVVSRIGVAGNQSMSTVRQVPAGKRLVVTGWHADGVASTSKIAILRIRASENNGVSNPGVYLFKASSRVKDSATGHLPIRFIIPAFAVIKISAWTDGTVGVSAQWQGYWESV